MGVIFVAYSIIWFFTTVLIIKSVEEKINFHPAWIALCTSIFLIVFLVRSFKKNYEPFKCPDCDELIEESVENSGASNEAIMYHCKKCDILWHTGETPSNG